ncbi:hypothetical protein LOZ32_003958 [Ophidiomyces ophidiicola]|nr:hypothetical protein LOZ32_003958 [Ophidiomyces ophidiicola]
MAPSDSHDNGIPRPQIESAESITCPSGAVGLETTAVQPLSAPVAGLVPPADHMQNLMPIPDESPLSVSENLDRVFPIRSVVSVQPSVTDLPESGRTPENNPSLSLEDCNAVSHRGQSQMVERSDSKPAANAPPAGSCSFQNPASPSISQTAQEKPREDRNHVTTRFKHIVTDKGHAVVTGHGDTNFQYCEDEPIHTPGAVQRFGAMLVLREESEGRLIVRVASENSESIVGYSPNDLFSLESFSSLLIGEQLDILLDHLEFVRDDAWNPSVDGPGVFIVCVLQPDGEARRLWCAIHINPAHKDLVICEFELEKDRINPLNVSGESVPLTPAHTLGFEPSPDVFATSTLPISQPLRVLRNARKRYGEAAAMDVFSILAQVQEQLAQAGCLDELLNICIGLIKELTGFHRVMIYQFDPSWNGIVVAELVDPRTSKDMYKDLRFPASDIPKQARELYKLNKVRLLYDRDHITARLVCRTLEDLDTPVDMTYSYLRAMSPIHVKYLANMGVRSSMSISIVAFGELWGLISCHSYGDSGMRVAFPIRKMCRLIGSALSRNIERFSYTSRLQARKLINTAPTDKNPHGYIVASSEDLLKLFDADYGAVAICDETRILGKPIDSQEILALVEYLRLRKINSVAASHCISEDFRDLRYPPGLKHIAGLLYVPLSVDGTDFIVCFRQAKVTEVRWGGNPYEKQIKSGTTGYLEPRRSFQIWRETVANQSREWSEAEVDTASVVCLVYGKFIRVWRQKEAAMEKSHLTKLLLANSAHEVRTPLNAVINYLEIAMENPLDQDTRDNLVKSHSASKSLIYIINDLLDLTNAGHDLKLIKDESFDFYAVIKEATEMFGAEAQRKGISYTVTINPGVARFVLGDQRRVRQVIMNLITNAFQHTLSGGVTVEFSQPNTEPEPGRAYVEMAVLDTGSGMSQAKLDELFHDLEQVSTDDEYIPEHLEMEGHLSGVKSSRYGNGERVLGLGLALVARIVRHLDGQLSVKSEEGKGSRFKILLQFPISENETDTHAELPAPPTIPSPPADLAGEFMLVKRNSATLHRRHSNESNRSGLSSRSGKSQADRLITAIQEPLEVNPTVDGAAKSAMPVSAVQLESELKKIEASSRIEEQMTMPSLEKTSMASTSPAKASARADSDVSMPQSTYLEATNEVPPASCSSPPPPPPPPPPTVGNPATLASSPSSQPNTSLVIPPFPKTSLSVLVAEDDPVNSKIIHKRLDRLGHVVHLTVNGEECAAAFRKDPMGHDAILMDIQMPIVDGILSTQMIREYENAQNSTSPSSLIGGRTIPIFAVSASLVERNMQKYIDTGFDGWIMKPVDFNQLSTILTGINQESARSATAYRPGMWHKGGWFKSVE